MVRNLRSLPQKKVEFLSNKVVELWRSRCTCGEMDAEAVLIFIRDLDAASTSEINYSDIDGFSSDDEEELDDAQVREKQY